MRPLLLTAVVVLGCGLLRAEEKKPYDMAELRPWFEKLLAIQLKFGDNFFILDEKLKEHSQELAECIGRPVEISLEVISVQRHRITFGIVDDKPITFTFQPSTGVTIPLYLPLVIADSSERPGLVLNFDETYSKLLPEGRLGERNMLPPHSDLSVQIGTLVPVEVAKALRRGNKLKLTGEIGGITVGKLAKEPPYMLGLIITEAKIERAEAE